VTTTDYAPPLPSRRTVVFTEGHAGLAFAGAAVASVEPGEMAALLGVLPGDVLVAVERPGAGTSASAGADASAGAGAGAGTDVTAGMGADAAEGVAVGAAAVADEGAGCAGDNGNDSQREDIRRHDLVLHTPDVERANG
jgi:hypothetical protein